MMECYYNDPRRMKNEEICHIKVMRKAQRSMELEKEKSCTMYSRLEPVIETARVFHRDLQNVLTYFVHPITSAVAEGFNSKIQTIKKMAYKFRNRSTLKQLLTD
jgi:transposase